MKTALRLAAGLALLVTVNACGESRITAPTPSGDSRTVRTPPPPAAPTNPPAPTSIEGTIRMTASTPASGGVLAVGECEYRPVPRTCTSDWTGTFDVSASADVLYAVLTVWFYDGDVPCGYAADTVDRIRAGEPATFRPTRIVLSDESGTFRTPCPLPATTTRMVAKLWTDVDWSVDVTQEFAATYKFVTR